MIEARTLRRDRLIALALALAISGGFLLAQLPRLSTLPETAWWQPSTGAKVGSLEWIARSGDGFIPVMLAQDPLIRRPEAFGLRGDGPVYRAVDVRDVWRQLAAYRWQRPAGVYLVWGTSGGRSGWASVSLLLLGFLGAALAAWGAAMLLQQVGVPGGWGAFVAILPGAYASMQFLGLEVFALGVLLVAIAKDDVRLHAIAGLFRETLLVPSMVCFARTREIRYLLPSAIFACWALFVRLRIGAWFFEADTGRLGFVERPWPILFLLVSALVRRSRWAPYIWGYAIVSVFLGWEVYLEWRHFTRPMLPWFTFVGMAALERHAELRRSGANGAGRSRA